MEDLVARYFKEEHIDDYNCENCGKRTRISRSQNIFRFPELLMVFIKRFRVFPQLEKNCSRVRVSPGNLHLEDAVFGEPKMPSDAREFLAEQKNRAEYELIGVIHHFGSIDMGHYVCEAIDRESKKWVLFNDDRVHLIDPARDIYTDHEDLYVMLYKSK